MSDIIIPATMSSDCLMSESLDLFAADIIPNSFPLSTENNVFQEGDPLDHLELSPNKRYALWKKDTVEYWNPWWRQVLSSAKTVRGQIVGSGVIYWSQCVEGSISVGMVYISC